MKYDKLALLVSLSILLHGTCYATQVGGAVTPYNTLVELLGPGEQSGNGAIVVSTPNGTVDISRTGYASVLTPGQPPSPPSPLSSRPATTGSATSGNSGSAGTGSATAAAGLSTGQVAIGLSASAIASSTSPQSSLSTTASSPASDNYSISSPSLFSTAVSSPVIDNHSADLVTSSVTAQTSQHSAAAAAQYFFDQGKDKINEALPNDASGELKYLTWGPWGSPLSQAPFTQSSYLVYSSADLADPATLAQLQKDSVTATYQGSLEGNVTYGNSTAEISVKNALAMTVNFGSGTLSFSGGGFTGSGSFTAAAPTVTGSIAFNGALSNNASANLSGNFHGAFFGDSAQELGAAWAMTGKVGATNATGAGILALRQQEP